MSNLSASLLVDCKNNLGEGIQWNEADRRVYWTDIFGNTLWSCTEDGSQIEALALDAGLCAFAFTKDGRMLAAFADALYWMDPMSGRKELIQAYQPDLDHTRMNDGGLDRQGRFIVGGIDENGMNPITPVWNVNKGEITPIIEGVGCANSTCFSPDGKTMYFADTAGKDIVAYDYDTDTGIPSNRRVFATVSDGGKPDGSTVDSQGGLWNASFGGGGVQHFLPDGTPGTRVTLPVPNVTCCCIGGQDMNRLFITTAKLAMSDEDLKNAPQAGGLYYVDLPVQGLPHGTYADT